MYINKTKEKKSQVHLGIIVLIFALVFGIYLYSKSHLLPFFWITGLAFGFVLQRSKFCFAAALRDPYLIGSTSLSKALLTSLALTSIGFTAIIYGYHISGLEISLDKVIVNISPALILGGILFGIGMVLAGGCATGVLMRTGEGFQTQFVALIFFIIGSLWGAHDFEWWDENFISKGFKVYLPDLFGYLGALVIQLLAIALLYILLDRWAEKRSDDLNL
ncbi:MAG: YeeE/YedE family protein [Tissierellia bacterium]|nr:YeeE/YedE family protein [Tissierellia bacterium]